MRKIIMCLILALQGLSSEISNSELERRIDLLAEEIESLKLEKTSNIPSYLGLGESASKVYSLNQGTSIGGYGEITLSVFDDENEQGTPSNASSKGEVLRNIIYIGHKFSKDWIFNSEIEIEHVNEIFVEFAYLDYLYSDLLNFRSGLLLLPLGLVNELHEPTLFNSVKRPEVEKYIIPSTWRELGLGFFGKWKNLRYKTYLVNGADADGFSSSGLRGGRKKGGVVSKSKDGRVASTIALATRLDYFFDNSFSVGIGHYLGSSSSQSANSIGTSIYQAHGSWEKKNLYFKGLFTMAKLSGVKEYNQKLSKNIGNGLQGYYLEGGYNFFLKKMTLTPFLRFEKYNTHHKVPSGVTKDLGVDKENITFGLAFKPFEKVVFKVDHNLKSTKDNKGVDETNFSIGYIF